MVLGPARFLRRGYQQLDALRATIEGESDRLDESGFAGAARADDARQPRRELDDRVFEKARRRTDGLNESWHTVSLTGPQGKDAPNYRKPRGNRLAIREVIASGLMRNNDGCGLFDLLTDA